MTNSGSTNKPHVGRVIDTSARRACLARIPKVATQLVLDLLLFFVLTWKVDAVAAQPLVPIVYKPSGTKSPELFERAFGLVCFGAIIVAHRYHGFGFGTRPSLARAGEWRHGAAEPESQI